MVLGEIIFGEVFGSHSTLIIRCLVVRLWILMLNVFLFLFFFVIFVLSWHCYNYYTIWNPNPLVEKDNWPSRLFYISFILIAIIIPHI